MPVVGILFIIGLGILTGWYIISRGWRYVRLKRNGMLVEARVTDIKRESRLVTQTGGVASTSQRLTYEDFLYAQWRDPLTQHVNTFRIKVQNFHHYRVGETIPVRMSLENPDEYFMDYSKSWKLPVPHSESVHQDYQQGYQAIEEDRAKDALSQQVDEVPEAFYPQQEMPEQQ